MHDFFRISDKRGAPEIRNIVIGLSSYNILILNICLDIRILYRQLIFGTDLSELARNGS